MPGLEDLYREIILDHHRNPRNRGELAPPASHAVGHNPLCGDEIDVYVENRENDNGLVELSKEKADRLKIWDEIAEACENEELVEGVITARVKGGLTVDIGVKAFLPGSQVDLRPVRNLEKYIGQRFHFKVIKFNKKRGNIVLSRRVLLEQERAEKRTETAFFDLFDKVPRP